MAISILGIPRTLTAVGNSTNKAMPVVNIPAVFHREEQSCVLNLNARSHRFETRGGNQAIV